MRTTSAPTTSRWRSWPPIWGSGSGAALRAGGRGRSGGRGRPQARDQPIDVPGDRAPIVEPVAREAHHDVGRVLDAPFVQAGSRRGAGAVARATDQKALRRGRIIDQILALIGRSVPERQHRKAGRTGHRLGGGITRIDGAQALARRHLVAGAGDGDEDAIELGDGAGCPQGLGSRRFGRRVRRLEGGPHEGEIDALMRTRPPLDRHPDRRRRQLEGDAADGDRQLRRIERDRSPRPARPQHIDDIGHRREHEREQKKDGRQQQAAAGAPGLQLTLEEARGVHGSAGLPNQRPSMARRGRRNRSDRRGNQRIQCDASACCTTP